jgi:hypothetical protein
MKGLFLNLNLFHKGCMYFYAIPLTYSIWAAITKYLRSGDS